MDDIRQELAELRAEVRRLRDLDEIGRIYTAYGRHLDDGDLDKYVALYARNAKVRLGPVMKADGIDEIRVAAAAMLERTKGGGRKSIHLLAPPRIEVDAGGDTASGECVWAAVTLADDGSPRIFMGRHVDTFVREDGAWKIAFRKGLADLGGMS